MTHTNTKTIAKARLATAGGEPRGFQATKTNIEAVKRMEPNPPKRYPIVLRNQRDGGGVSALRPYSLSFRATCSVDNPCLGDVDKRLNTSSVGIVCQSRFAMSEADSYQLSQ